MSFSKITAWLKKKDIHHAEVGGQVIILADDYGEAVELARLINALFSLRVHVSGLTLVVEDEIGTVEFHDQESY